MTVNRGATPSAHTRIRITRTALAVLGLITTFCAPATAQERTAQVQALIDAAHAEQRVFLTCTSLMPETHQSMLATWEDMVERSDRALESLGFSLLYRTAFRATSLPSTLTLPGDTPYAELLAFCSADPEWERKAYTLNFTLLDLELGRLSPQ